MSIKSILAPVRGDGKGEEVLSLAIAIGRIFNAHIDVVHVHAKPQDMIPFGVPVPRAFKKTILEAADNVAKQEEGKLKQLFADYCGTQHVEVLSDDATDAPLDKLSLSWREEAGKQAVVLRRLGRLADLIVIAKPDRQAALGVNSLHSALFDVRKLTAIAPPHGVEETGRRIAIAWNGSAEIGRTVTWALPLLAAAEQVTILTTPLEREHHLSPDALVRYLHLHGIAAGTEYFKKGPRDIGAPLLRAAGDVGADMIVMGAFGSEKRRELVLGGVTQYVIEHADLPLLMAH
jgi:nucleotide-binding universal stress UspA family protein